MRLYILFFFNDAATTEIYTLSLHDALPIFEFVCRQRCAEQQPEGGIVVDDEDPRSRLRVRSFWLLRRVHLDRKSTRLNSSHPSISYAVFSLKKKKNIIIYMLRS